MVHGAVALVLAHGEDRDRDGHSEALTKCRKQAQEVRRAGHMVVEQPWVPVQRQEEEEEEDNAQQ